MTVNNNNPVAERHVSFSNSGTGKYIPCRGSIPEYEKNEIIDVRPSAESYAEAIDSIQKQGGRIASQKSFYRDGYQIMNIEIKKGKKNLGHLQIWSPIEKNAPKAVDHAEKGPKKSCLKKSAAPIAIDEAALRGEKQITNEEPPRGHAQKHNLSAVNKNWNKVYQ